MSAQFGILTTNKTALTSIMIIQSVSVTDEDDFVEAIDESGEIEAVQQVTKPDKITVEGIITGTAPASGDDLTIDTVAYQIRSVEVKEENEAWKMVSLEGVQKTWA